MPAYVPPHKRTTGVVAVVPDVPGAPDVPAKKKVHFEYKKGPIRHEYEQEQAHDEEYHAHALGQVDVQDDDDVQWCGLFESWVQRVPLDKSTVPERRFLCGITDSWYLIRVGGKVVIDMPIVAD